MIRITSDILPFGGFTAMTVWPFIFVRRDREHLYTGRLDRHEHIHAIQQTETLVVGMAVAAGLMAAGCGWWSLLAVPLFFWWYVTEWLVRLAFGQDMDEAYRGLFFEREAYGHQDEEDYLLRRRPLAWLFHRGDHPCP